MPRLSTARKKHRITWEEFVAFVATTDRDVSHAFRVFKGERSSQALTQKFEAHFGFPMRATALAGRRKQPVSASAA